MKHALLYVTTSWEINLGGEPSAVGPVIVYIQVAFPAAAVPLCSMVQGLHQASAFQNASFIGEYSYKLEYLV